MMELTKMHGLGNSYVVIEDLQKKYERRYPEMARAISDKSFGIGSDGILVVNRGKIAKYHMRIFNPDGSEAELSGNGSRIFSTYLYDRKMIGSKAQIEAGGKNGGRLIEISINRPNYVSVGMGKGKLISKKTIAANGAKFTGNYINVGNPHFVVFVKDEKTAKHNSEFYGSSIEHNSTFPNGVNVEFAYVKSRKEIILHVWERGTGITIACGTGACATAFSAVRQGIVDSKVRVKLLGGYLEINISNDDSILMSGPVAHIFSGKLYLDEVVNNMV